jgi:hypothetical protein
MLLDQHDFVSGQGFITDKNEDLNRPKIVLIDRENKTLVIDIEVLLTRNLFNTEAEKVTKYENLTLGIKISGSLTAYIHSP